MAGMSDNTAQPTPAVPDGNATLASDGHPLPDCITASSNRFADLLPFCNRHYHADPQKWCDILPWEFPQNGTKEVEENFIQQWFDKLDIHMNGGEWYGYLFLKQAWYSIALYNWEQRVPCIANMWMNDNKALVEDESMFEFFCNPDVQVQTFFTPDQIQVYGTKMLGFAVRKIQDAITKKSRRAKTAYQSHNDESAMITSSSESSDQGGMHIQVDAKPEELSTTSTSEKLASPHASQASAEGPVVPFPIYREPGPHLRGTSREFTPACDNQQYSQPYGRRRGMSGGKRFNSGGGSRYPTRQQYNQFENAMPHPPEMQGYPGMHPQAYLPPSSMHPGQGFNQPPQMMNPAAGQFVPPTTYKSQGMPDPAAFNGGYNSGFNHDGMRMNNRGGHGQFGARNFSNESAAYGFEDFTNRRGDQRRSSQSSRNGGGFRGTGRGYRGRGGRESNYSDHAAFPNERMASRASNDFGNKGKHRMSQALENGQWRSTSDQPQLQHALPERSFTGPGQEIPTGGSYGPRQFSDHQKFPGQSMGGPNVFPPQGAPTRAPSDHSQSVNGSQPKDDVIERNYVGADAIGARRLIMFEVPIEVDNVDVALAVKQTFDVQVVNMARSGKNYSGSMGTVTSVFMDFADQHDVRKILQSVGVEIFGRPSKIEVPKQMWDPTHSRYNTHPSQDARQASASFGTPYNPLSAGIPPWPDNPQGRKLFDPKAPMTNAVGPHLAATGAVPTPPAAPPYNLRPPPSTRHDPTLSTVPSAENTPTASSANTPKRKNKNKERKERPFKDTGTKRGNRGQENAGQGASTEPGKKDSKSSESGGPGGSKKGSSAGRDDTKADQDEKSGPATNVDVDEEAVRGLAAAVDSKRPSKAQPNKDAKEISKQPVKDTSATAPPEVESSKGQHQKSESDQQEESFHTADGSPAAELQPIEQKSGKDIVAISTSVTSAQHSSSSPAGQERLGNVSPKTTNVPILFDEKVVETEATGLQVSNTTNHCQSSAAKPSIFEPHAPKATSPPLSISDKRYSEVAGSNNDAPVPSAPKENAAPSLNVQRVVSDGSNPRTPAFRTAPTTPAMTQAQEVTETSQKAGKPDGTDAADAAKATETGSLPTSKLAEENKLADVKTPDTKVLDETKAVDKTAKDQEANVAEMTERRNKGKGKAESPETGELVDKQDNAPKPAVQPKSAEKQKGPSQTESLSMFGKKQNKKPKRPKGGSIRGQRPTQDQANSVTSDTSRVVSSASTPASKATDPKADVKATPSSDANVTPSGKNKKSEGNDTRSDKPKADTTINGKAKGDTRADSVKDSELPKLDTTVPNDKQAARSSVSSSPSKRHFGNLFGLFSGTSKPASVASSPDVFTSKPNAENELTESKTKGAGASELVASAKVAGAVGNDVTADIVAKSKGSVISEDADLPATEGEAGEEGAGSDIVGLGISMSNVVGPDISSEKTTPAKKKKKNKKGKQRQAASPEDEYFKTQESKDAQEPTQTIPTLTLDPRKDDERDSDSSSTSSSRTADRKSPPASPKPHLTPSKRKLLEMRGETEHILQAPAPLNHHSKRKPSNKAPSETASQSSSGETSNNLAALQRHRASAKSKRQENVLNLFNITSANAILSQEGGGSDGQGEESSNGRPQLLILSMANYPDNEATEHSRVQLVGNTLKFIGAGTEDSTEDRVTEMEEDEAEDGEVEEVEAEDSGKTSPASETGSEGASQSS